jgi:hypothetical protein
MRRISSYLSPAAAVMFILVLIAAKQAEGIRLDAETRAAVSGNSNNMVNVSSDSGGLLIRCLISVYR